MKEGTFDKDDKSTDVLNKKLRIKVKYKPTNESSSMGSVEPSDKKKAKRDANMSSKRKREETVKVEIVDDETRNTESKRSRKSVESKISKKTRSQKGLSEEKEFSEEGKKTTKRKDLEDDSTIYLDISFWKSRREALSGEFADARKNFTEHGPWRIPSTLPDSFFDNIAEKTLDRMSK